jgi:hypothetical protein
MRPLGSYLSDLYKRLDMLSEWAAAGKPPSVFWLPGFFFVQSFLTAGTSPVGLGLWEGALQPLRPWPDSC